MTRFQLIAVPAFVFAGTLAAQAQLAQIPTPANPFPTFPVATNGTPLARHNYDGSGYGAGALLTGRSVGFDRGADVPADYVGGPTGLGFAR